MSNMGEDGGTYSRGLLNPVGAGTDVYFNIFSHTSSARKQHKLYINIKS